MSATPLIPGSLYGLRTWRVVAGDDGEELAASHRTARWPPGGAWVHATCDGAGGHVAPDPGCSCGIHAWHPRRASARRVLGSRFELPGIVEAQGTIELQEDGFRAARARPHAFVVTPGRNAARARRLARRYGADVVEVGGPGELLAWCERQGLGLAAPTVDALLGPEQTRRIAEQRRRQRRRDVLRVGVVAAIAGVSIGVGAGFASGPPSPRGVYGRTGWVTLPSTCRTTPAPAPHTAPAPGHRPDC